MARRKKRSKKRSGASSSSKPLDQVSFFLDESIGARTVANALRAVGAQVEVHSAHFAQGTADEEWLEDVGKRGWVVLTRDKRIRYRQVEQNALLAAGVKAFVFTGGNVAGPDMATTLARAAVRIADISVSERGPFIYTVARSGVLSRVR